MPYYRGYRVLRAKDLGRFGEMWAGNRQYPSARTGWQAVLRKHPTERGYLVKWWKTTNSGEDWTKDTTETKAMAVERFDNALTVWKVAVDECIDWANSFFVA